MLLNGFQKKTFFRIGMWHSRPPRDPPPFMAKTILNFHLDYLKASLITHTIYLSICTLPNNLCLKKVHQKVFKFASGPNWPNSPLYANKVHRLEEVHHRQLWRLWLISAILSRENDHFWHDWAPNENFASLLLLVTLALIIQCSGCQ